MSLRPLYWKLCVIWALLAVMIVYYAFPFEGWLIVPRFEGVFDFLTWLLAAFILLFPMLGLPFFIRKE